MPWRSALDQWLRRLRRHQIKEAQQLTMIGKVHCNDGRSHLSPGNRISKEFAEGARSWNRETLITTGPKNGGLTGPVAFQPWTRQWKAFDFFGLLRYCIQVSLRKVVDSGLLFCCAAGRRKSASMVICSLGIRLLGLMKQSYMNGKDIFCDESKLFTFECVAFTAAADHGCRNSGWYGLSRPKR